MFDLIRSSTTVTGTLGRGDNAHNCRVVDVEAPANREFDGASILVCDPA
jgi:hypothetical protein